MEMRQVAGLTAGSATPLQEGTFQFSESEEDTGFTVSVGPDGRVLVTPGSTTAWIDEFRLTQASELGSSVLNVGSACFVVRHPRPTPTTEARLAKVEAARRPAQVIPVPPLDDDGVGTVADKHSFLGGLLSRDEEPATLSPHSWSFLESIRDVRNAVADRHRQIHPDPEELNHRLSTLDPGLWDRGYEHPLFGRIGVAYATIPWSPYFDDPDRIPQTLHQPISQISNLPWIPITANLLVGPLAIVGRRSAALACARHAMLSLASLSSPGSMEFAILTAKRSVDDWAWTASLPRSMFPTGSNSYCVAVADGITHFESAGYTHEDVKEKRVGLIVLADSIDEIPSYSATIVELAADGTCRVTNHLAETIAGTPIGVTSVYARDLASKVTGALGSLAAPIGEPGTGRPPEPRVQRSTEPATTDATPSVEQLATMTTDLSFPNTGGGDQEAADVEIDLTDATVEAEAAARARSEAADAVETPDAMESGDSLGDPAPDDADSATTTTE